MYKTPSKKATIPSKKSYEVLQPNIAAGSRAFLKLYLNLNCIPVYEFWRYNFKLHITLFQDQKKGKSLTRSYSNEKLNTIAKKCWPHCVILESRISFPPYFLLVFLWPRFLSFSFATFNRSQEELFLSSLANNLDAKHLFKATFVIPEGRHYYILQRFLYALIFC